jgi:hypothetical protein
MTKTIFTLLSIVLVYNTSFAWGTRGHETTTKIAEKHLTPRAKKVLNKYLHGNSIVDYASWADEYKKELLFDVGFEPSNYPSRMLRYPHTFEANADCSVFDGDRRGDEWVKNCVYMAVGYANDLKADHKNMDKEERFHKIAMLIHWLGDMHCPAHIRYPDDQTSSGYEVMMGDRAIWYHRLWDGILFNWLHPSSRGDAAEAIDTCTAKEIAKIVEGGLLDWGKDSATASRATRKYREGAQIDRDEFLAEFSELHDSQIRNGGYRLAKLFNEIFQ